MNDEHDDGYFIRKTDEQLDEEESTELDRQVLILVIGVIVFVGGVILGIGSAII